MTTKHLAVFSTRDLKLATILLTLGFEPENPAAPATRIRRDSGEETTVFHFLASSPTGQQANQVMEWFRDADIFLEKNPDHPVAYILAALRNRDTLVSVVKATPRQLVFERNGKIVSISENATEADKKRFAKFL
jgi:hypothetical protein